MSLKKIDEIIKGSFKHLNVETKFKVYPLWKKWAEIVGAEIAKKSTPAFIENEVLFVDVEHPVWATELGYQKTQILKQIELAGIDVMLKDIKFRVKK